MKERPILFSGPMVRAILEGRKTQTRRVVKESAVKLPNGDGAPFFVECPYGIPGDRLWVRETFAMENNREYFGDPNFAAPQDGRPIKHHDPADEEDSAYDLIPRYRATESADLCCPEDSNHDCGGPCLHPWRPSIHMPRWASRITLDITDVSAQRLQDISEEDAREEGAGATEAIHEEWDGDPDEYRKRFCELWNSINAKRGFGWDVNPWVWAITFKRTA